MIHKKTNIEDGPPWEFTPLNDDELREIFNVEPEYRLPTVHPKRIYVAHPLRGQNVSENVAKVTEICKQYANRRDIIPFSPIHAFGFVDPMQYDQQHGMQMCFSLLSMCDELWVHGKFWISEGCQAEICYAGCRKIPIKFIL